MAAIGEIVAQSWQHTFQGLLPQDFLSSLTPEAQQSRHERNFSRDGVHYHTAVDGNDVIGFASWGPRRDPSFAAPYELYAIYLRPGFERQGIGRRLLDRVISDVASSDPPDLYLTVLSVNPNREFYVRLGGTEVDAPSIQLGGISHEQIAFLWSCLPAAKSNEGL